MKNRTVSLPLGMVSRKFYCHRCGTQLVRKSRTRTLRRGDPDYQKYSGTGEMKLLGDIHVTEYDFHCSACDTIIGYQEQCAIEYIQKRAGRHILSQSEITAVSQEAKTALDWKGRLASVLWAVLFAAAVIVILYLQSRTTLSTI